MKCDVIQKYFHMLFTIGKMFVMFRCVQIFTCHKQFLKSLFITKCMNMLFATRIINFFVLRRIRALKVVMKCEIVAVVIVNVVVSSTPFLHFSENHFCFHSKAKRKTTRASWYRSMAFNLSVNGLLFHTLWLLSYRRQENVSDYCRCKNFYHNGQGKTFCGS